MTLLITLFTATLFVLLVPGILFKIPLKRSPLLVAIIHGLIFAAIYYVLQTVVLKSHIHEGFTLYAGQITPPLELSMNCVNTDGTLSRGAILPANSTIPIGSTLNVGTQLTKGSVFPVDIVPCQMTLPNGTSTLSTGYRAGTALDETITLAADINIPTDMTTTADIVFSKCRSNGRTVRMIFPPNLMLSIGTTIPKGSTLGKGTVLPVSIPLEDGTINPKNVALPKMTTIDADIIIDTAASTTAVIVMPLQTKFITDGSSSTTGSDKQQYSV